MQQTPQEVIAANLAFIVFWILVATLMWLVGQRWERTRAFRARMIAQWQPALVITLIYLASNALSGRSFINLYAPAIFCQALIGLAIARGIAGYEPLATTRSILRRERMARNILLLIVIGTLAGIAAMVIGSVGMGIVRSILHETMPTRQAPQSFPIDKTQAFFQFLWGAGIAEEMTYRLVALSFVWAKTGQRWFAIFVSAMLFAAYHLSPLDGMYLRFWQFPVSQFSASVLIGIVWGFVFTQRDYETVVLSHTLSDWIPLFLFT